MTEIKFKYRLDRRCRIITWSAIGTIIAGGVLLWIFSAGAYLPAWFASIALAFIALAALSIPCSIRITDDAVEIRCLLEISHIPYHHIRNVGRTERVEFKPLLPVFASMGFFGHFGYYLDVRNRDFIKIYATSWHGLVVIDDIYEQRYLVNVDDPDKFCEAVTSRITASRMEKTPQVKDTTPKK